ncbi:MAG TPA: methionine--tRNA ligase [Parachlamydiaceae bacterium]|nr:methionine--tRNA ligase [Parachlamydiaceae bacterium]
MNEKILITSALPYANGPLHFGHIAGAYLPADCYARFLRLQKKDVLYICGSDEYGIAITMSADLAGRSPKEHVDIFHAINLDFFKKLNISFDHYSRTTWEGHNETVCQYFLDLLKNGYIEERMTEQLYSEKDQKFLADRYVAGECPKCGFLDARGDECPKCGASYEATDLKNPRSKLSNAPLTLKPTKHWFLLLDKFKDKLLAWAEKKEWKPNVLNFVKSYIQELRPRGITRDSSWGIPIPLPETDGKVLYVWFDAPIGYISATKEWAEKTGDAKAWKNYWQDPHTKLVHFIGKDNIPFHGAIFPAMTMGQDEPFKLVDELPANEFYNLEGRQFSKSDGWMIDLDDFFKNFTADQIRYAIASNAPETSDSEFTWKDFQLRCNSDLLGKYGNLVNRVLVFAKNNCEGKVPSFGTLEELDLEFLEAMKKLVKEAEDTFKQFKLRRASQIVMELAALGNSYFDKKKPWVDAKADESKPKMYTTIACCLECLKLLSLISFPIIPETASQVFNLLGFKENLEKDGWRKITEKRIQEGQLLSDPKILFNRIEDAQIEQEIIKLKAMSETANKEKGKTYLPLKEEVSIEEFKKLDLRVATITKAVRVPKSKKLLHLEVDLGFETRSVVSGISQFYKEEELIGKKIVLVANLKPAFLMGVESHGMILAASDEKLLEVLSIQSLPNGSVVS